MSYYREDKRYQWRKMDEAELRQFLDWARAYGAFFSQSDWRKIAAAKRELRRRKTEAA
jgi:hypothetical protein